MKRLALVLALATTFAATSAVLTAADDDLDKQYLGRRKAADDRVAGGFLAFAKTLERKKCGERAKVLASHVLVVGSALQAKEAQGILDRIAQSPTKGQDDDLEAQIREAIAKYRKGYEDVSAYCEKKGLTAELADVKARIEKCEACALPDPKAPPPPEKKGGDAKSGDDKKSSGDELKDCLNRVNFFRKLALLDEVKNDEKASAGCKAHSDYLVLNEGSPWVAGLKAHVERVDMPGYSGAGAIAGQQSVIAWSSPVDAVDAWMGSFYHRIPVIDPRLEKVGIGWARYKSGGSVSCLDVKTGLGRPNVQGGSVGVVVFPVDKQTNVPLAFMGELPDPIPEGAERPAGYPITLTGFGDAPYRQAEGTLETEAGKKVDCHFSNPDKPALPTHGQENTLCLIPKKPLAPDTSYKVTFKYLFKGEEHTKVTTFKTAAN